MIQTSFLIMLLGITTLLTLPEPVRAITLDDAIAMAAERNRSLAVLRQELVETATLMAQAESAYLPQFELNGGYTYVSRLPRIELGDQLPIQLPQINFGSHHLLDFNLSAGYVLFDWGKRGDRVQQATLARQLQELKIEAVLQQVIYQTTKAYSAAALARERASLLQKYVDNADSHLVDARSKYDNGLVSEFDLLKSELQLKVFGEELAVAQAELRQAELRLSELIGADSDTTLSADQPLSAIELQVPPDQQFDSLLVRKPEVQLNQAQIELSGLTEKLESLRPKVTLFSSAGWKNNVMPDPDELLFNFTGGAKVSYRFFDGGLATHKQAEERARQVRFQLENERVVSEARRSIAVAREEMLKIESKQAATGEKLAVARKALEIARVSYGVGLITNSEYLDTELEIRQIEMEALRDHFELLQAQLELKYNIGYWPEVK